MKKIPFIIGLLGVMLVASICTAAHVSVGTSGTPGKIEIIRIYVDPNGYPIEDTERILAEREVIDRLASEKIYSSEEEKLMDRLRQRYDIEEINENGKNFWKCTPKNPKTIIVKKSKTVVKESPGMVEHVTEYYNEEQQNPNYLEQSELEKKVLWFEVEKVEKKRGNTKVRF